MAIDNIARWGDTDVFPLPVDNHVLHDRPAEAVQLLEAIHADFEGHLAQYAPANQSSLALVGYTGFRWATQLDPIWNAYLLGLVIAIAPQIEAERLPVDRATVFSYRYEPDPADSGLFKKDAWNSFLSRSRELADQFPHVLTCDIADFYSRIYHHRLENALRFAASTSDIPKRIMTLLGHISGNTSYGLPVGGPAARLLSELLLNRTDRLLVSEGVVFARFADDYHVFTSSTSGAFAGLQTLSDKLFRNEGLSLQKAKTRVLSAEEFKGSAIFYADDQPPITGQSRGFIALSLRFDPYSPTAEDDYETLRAEVDRYDITGMLARELQKTRVNPALTRRLIRALQFVAPHVRDAAVMSLMESLDVLAPIFPTVMRTVRDVFSELLPKSQAVIADHLLDLIEQRHYLLTIELNLAYALRVIALQPTERAEAALIDLYDSVTGDFVRRDIVLILARWHARYWLSDRKNYFGQMHPWVKRAFLIASYKLGDEGGHWRRSIRASLSPFDALTLEWASQRIQHAGWEPPI